jgi:hypothetical protein
MSIDQTTKCTLLAPDGGVRYIPLYLKDDLLKKGWKVINNPKSEYYPAYDVSLQGNVSGSDTVEEEDNNFLEIKII